MGWDRVCRRLRAYLPKLLSSLLTRTNLVDDSGIPMPITEDVLAGLGYPVLNAVAQRVLSDMTPGKQPEPSSAGSFGG